MHVCARRSTGPIDRSAASTDGRPDRSTVLLLLLLIPSAAADSFGDNIVDFLSLPTYHLASVHRVKAASIETEYKREQLSTRRAFTSDYTNHSKVGH